MDKCSCGECADCGGWYVKQAPEISYPEYCWNCGDQLLPDGRVIQRETIPNKLMAMLKEVQDTCPENGLQEFALRCFNWIEGYINENDENIICSHHRFEEKAGVPLWTIRKLEDKPGGIKLKHLFRLLNAAKQEAKSGD